MGRDAVSVICVAALIVFADGARRHTSVVEEHSHRGQVICPMKAEVFGFNWKYPAKSCIKCNPHFAFNKQLKEDLFSATDCTKGAAPECKPFKKPNLCACVPQNGNGKARFAYFLTGKKKCDSPTCFKSFGDLQSKMHGYVVSFSPNAFENPMSRCKKCQAATTPEEREELDCDTDRMTFGTHSEDEKAKLEEMGIEVNEEFEAPEVNFKDDLDDDFEEEEEEEEDEEDDDEEAAAEADGEEEDAGEAEVAPTGPDEELYAVAAVVQEEDTPEELQAVMETSCPPKTIWNLAGYPRCRDAATKRFVMTECCAAQIAAADAAGKMCNELIGNFNLPKCESAGQTACKKSTNNCKVAGRKPHKVFKRAGINGHFPKGYRCKVAYMCDFPDRPAVGPMDFAKCHQFGGTAKNMCTAA